MSRCLVVLAVALAACSSSSDKTTTQADCDAIANDIRQRAAAHTPPLNSDGICNAKDPTVQQEFGDACHKLQDCNAHCCK